MTLSENDFSLLDKKFGKQKFSADDIFGGQNFRQTKFSAETRYFRRKFFIRLMVQNEFDMPLWYRVYFEFQPRKYCGGQNYRLTNFFGGQNFRQRARFSAVFVCRNVVR